MKVVRTRRRWFWLKIKILSRHSSRTLRTQRSAKALVYTVNYTQIEW